MAKPPTSVRSIRLPDELWAKLTVRAAETGMSVNALIAAGAGMAVTVIVHRSDVQFEADYNKARIKLIPPGPTQWPSGAMIEPHHTEDPVPKLTLGSSVTFGPTEPKPGSRLKKGKTRY